MRCAKTLAALIGVGLTLLQARAPGQVPGPQLPGPSVLRPVPAPVVTPPQGPARAGPVASAKPDESPGGLERRGDAAQRLGNSANAFELYMQALKRPPFPLAQAINIGPPPGPQPLFWGGEDERRHRVMGKVIAAARRMSPPPEIPEGARRAMTEADTIAHAAGSVQDFARALSGFKRAVDLAPWWPRALWGVAILAEQVGDYTTALNHLKLYQLAAPDRDDEEVRILSAQLDRKRRSS